MDSGTLAVYALMMVVAVAAAVSAVLFLMLRSELKHIQKGLTDLTNVNTRTNIYAQTAIADKARRDMPMRDVLAAISEDPSHRG